MVLRKVYRGNDYVIRRYLFSFALVGEDLQPLPLAGCTVRSAWRPAAVEPGDQAVPDLHASIVFDEEGEVTSSDDLALPSGGVVGDAVLELLADRDTTLGLDAGTMLRGDVLVTDANGEDFTVEVLETITVENVYTYRPTV